MATTQIHFRMDEQEAKEFEFVIKQVGLTPNAAFKIFAKKSIESGGIPFEMSQPNQRLLNAIKSRDYVEFDNAKEGLDWLNED
ncbi:type II toxin-antitoxin system RelB/DinJ family antitoxin [Oenococcus sp. UCMA 17063]|nr:type II toxin-antitoxin system RelB/DinJ family antitoxin [Oenococcus sp. UCMA 17063]